MANIYDKVPAKVQKKSGFDKSFQNLFTGKVGTIIPILTDELIPNSTVRLRVAMTTQLPPLASDTFMRVKQKYAAFFVPTRILVPRYEDWLTGQTNVDGAKVRLPVFSFNPELDKVAYGNGSLLDYLGYKCSETKFTELQNIAVSALPMLAYHKIWNDWFRNSLVQKDIFKVLDCERKIGLTLNESLLMSPSKSVTAIVGIAAKPKKCKANKCDACDISQDCQFRGI